MSAEETTLFGLVTQLVGPDAAVRLTKALGGRRIYVPRSPGAAHPITAAVGLEAAMALAARFGGEQLEVPLMA